MVARERANSKVFTPGVMEDSVSNQSVMLFTRLNGIVRIFNPFVNGVKLDFSYLNGVSWTPRHTGVEL
jgi:hypothetical protein